MHKNLNNNSMQMWFPRSTDYISAIHDFIPRTVLNSLNLTTRPLPFEMPSIIFRQAWLPQMKFDLGHLWLRSVIKRAAKQVLQPNLGDSFDN